MIYLPRNFEWLQRKINEDFQRRKSDLQRQYAQGLYDAQRSSIESGYDLDRERAEWLYNA